MSLLFFSGDSSSVATQSAAALKIQKTFLGFLVRKSFHKIIDLNRRVDEIQTQICTEDSFDLIMKNEIERIKVNEALMSLILQLDSLDVYYRVRCCRKAVVKKAIALQETVDAIGSIGSAESSDCMIIENGEEVMVDDSLSSSKSRVTSHSAASLGEIETVMSDVKSCRMNKDLSDKELMEKLMEDNLNMMNMMQEVFEMNHLQAQTISALTLRVEQLERARMDDNMRKIRKRMHQIETASSKQ